MLYGKGEGLEGQVLAQQLSVGIFRLLQPFQGCIVGHDDERAPEKVVPEGLQGAPDY